MRTLRALRLMLLWTAAGLALLYLAGCGAMYVWQRSLLYFPQPARQAVASMTLPVDGATLQISVRAHPGAPAVLYFGGNAEDVSATMPQLAGLFPDHALYGMHYRGYGQSTGAPSESALHADARALYEHVRPGHPEIKVVGRSLGSGVAARLASEQPVARLVLITPYDSIENVAAGQYPWLPVRWLIRDRFDSAGLAGRIGVPTTLIAAERDTLIRPERTARLLAHFRPGVARLVNIPGAGHGDIGASPLYARALADAVR
ncbi:MAG: alpha/beta fold hydrolase [Hydrogenophaga sp.]|uniref:alpha/beta hydrolase n=1 Tax=Hydrogenophaga sp. TaxID=1904254 RepID=UPI0025C290F4|nr:alpha/beta fold hydrolase [Hydrogenophaga sp.]MBT9551113.1 alpha/beta fold hydrolase [Hydrogenophaga sp.]